MPLDKDLTEFTTASDPAIASYDWVDIATRTGYIELFVGETEGAKVLVTKPFYAEKSKEYSIATDTAVDEDFDILLGKPLEIEGDAIVTIPTYLWNNTGGTLTLTSTLTITLRKWDGTTETDLATDSVAISGNLLTEQKRGEIHSIGLTVPKTHFKDGDTIRLNVTATSSGAAGKIIYFFRDPKNRDVTAFGLATDASYPLSSTIMNINLPTNIDL